MLVTRLLIEVLEKYLYGRKPTKNMWTPTLFSIRFLAAIILLAPGHSLAEKIRVAVASNFTAAITSVTKRFEVNTDHEVTLIFGSTGKHYAQIKNGAPFDAFFAADVRRPELLEKQGLSLPDSRFTYAVGKLVLWSPKAGYVDPEASILERGTFHHLAIANPKLAPYGEAAQEILEARGLRVLLRTRLVRGENIGQAFQFVKSGNAELGFVAYSQVKRANHPIEGSFWKVPQALYTPIEQQAVLLKDKKAASAFMRFVRSEEVLKIIREYGYDTP